MMESLDTRQIAVLAFGWALVLMGTVGCASMDEAPPPPSDPALLRDWLLDEHHHSWEGHATVQQTEGLGGIRLFYNPLLADSLRRQQTRHPVGAMAIREIYAADLATLDGYAVLIKVAQSDSVDDWFYYEIFQPGTNPEPMVAAHGATQCVGCHMEAVDFIRSSPVHP